MKKNLTEGSILRSLLTLSIPIVLANILQTAYQLTDTFWVGRLGAEAVASISLSFPIIFLLISVGAGFAVAGSVLVSQYTGRRDQQMVDYISAQTLIVMVVCSIFISIFGYLVSPWIIHAMGAGPKVSKDAVSYLQISFMGLIFMYTYFVYQSLMRGIGDVKTPFFVVLITVLLNFVLDPLFILGWGPFPAFGVRGAAMSTIGTQGIAALVGIIMMSGGRYGIRLKRVCLKPDMQQIMRILRLGLPASVEQSTRALSMTIMTFLVASFGTEATAVYGIGTRILSFVIIPALGFAMSTSTLVGQNIGAEKVQRADHTAKLSISVIFVTLTLAGVFSYVFADSILRIFVPNEERVIAGGAYFIRIMSLTFGLIGVQQVTSGVLRGSGNTASSMLLAIISLWVIRFPIAYVLSYHTQLHVDGIWWSFAIGNIIAAAIALAILYRGGWKRPKLSMRERPGTEDDIERAIAAESLE